nr:glycosyltransferase [uncultured Limnohabitans sp.]
MSTPRLTIIVPTYNRCDSLELLLRSLADEVRPLGSEVEVYVSDNASTDDTPSVVERLRTEWPELISHRQATNVGPDRNFSHCVHLARGRWFWIISDDDMPKRSVVSQVLSQLLERQPALLYLESEWVNPLLSADQGEPVGTFRVADMDARRFAAAVHVWVTFISGMVVDKERLLPALGLHNINRFDATNLVQLGWVLPLLNSPGPFLLVADRCMLATKDNTGGYGLLTVFGVNFTRIVNESFGADHPLARALIGGNVTKYLPGLIWGARNAQSRTSHMTESPWRALNGQLGSHWLYWLLLVPLGRLPRFLAQPFFQTWRVLNRLRREWRQRFGDDMKGAV